MVRKRERERVSTGRSRAVLAAAVLLATSTASRAMVPSASEEDVRRVLTLLTAVGEEYREGVKDGTVVRPIEFEEAKTFLDDARQRFQRLTATLPSADPDLSALFADAAASIDRKVAADEITGQLTALRQRLVARTGVSEQIYPPQAPSAQRGRALFDQYCVSCHGERGDGKGPNAAGLDPAPANFTDTQFIRGETPYDFYHVISLGKSHTAMPAWDGVLSIQERWDLVSYLWTLAPGAAGLGDGQGIYLSSCAGCHGATGNGQGAYSAVLMKRAPDLSQPQSLARQADADLFAIASHGIAGSPMPSFARVLGEDERWKAVAFMRHLSLGGPGDSSASGPVSGGTDGRRFGGLLRLLGRSYAAAWTGGELTSAVAYDEAAALMQQVSVMAEVLAQRLLAADAEAAARLRREAASIADRVQAKAAPADVLASIDALAGWSAAEAGLNATADGPAAGTTSATGAALDEAARLLDAATAAYAQGDLQASGTVAEAYLQFEPLEQSLGARDPGLKSRIEERFLQLRQRLRTPGNEAEVHALATAIHDDFAAVRDALQPHTSPYALFLESATIILREGFEIVLVIGALIAYVVKTGNAAMRRSIYAGTLIGIAASLLTAFIMGEILQLHPGSSDLLEGITMLLAAVVLFWVSYWLISKSEADRWQRYIRSKVQTALTDRRSVALAGAAFLAVYREGFETVLFYQALYASAPAASMTVSAGFCAGAIALAIVYVLFRRFQVQIPLQQFFFVTGLLLYVMAAIFAGQGVHELQEAGWLAMTPVPWVPAVPLLGLYPSVQSLLAQMLFVTLLVYATAVTLRRRRRSAAEAQAVEDTVDLRALREAIGALRDELVALRSREATVPLPELGERIEDLLVHAETTAARVHASPSATGRPHGNGH